MDILIKIVGFEKYEMLFQVKYKSSAEMPKTMVEEAEMAALDKLEVNIF